MTNDEYQKRTATTAIYPKENGVEYVICGLASEAGEVIGKWAKSVRGDYGESAVAFTALTHDLDKEIGDCLWMISQYCNETGTTIGALMEMNIRKLAARQERGTLQGSGDDR